MIEAVQSLSEGSGIEIIATAAAHRDWRDDLTFMSCFDRAVLVIVNGEGSLHHSRPAGANLLAAGPLAAAAGKRSVLLNFSWFENDRHMADALASFDMLSARESMSQRAVRQIRPDCRLVPDLSLYGAKAHSDRRDGIGFGDSVLPAVTADLMKAKKRFGGRFVPVRYSEDGARGAYRFLRSLVSRQAFWSPADLSRSLQSAAAQVLNAQPDSQRLLAAISQLQLLVTGRFHGVALALCANTPVLAVRSNIPKIEPLLDDAGIGSWRLVSPHEIDERLLEKASSWRDGEEASVGKYLASASVEAERLFRDIRAMV